MSWRAGEFKVSPFRIFAISLFELRGAKQPSLLAGELANW